MKINWKIKAGIAVVVLAGCAFGGWKYYQGQQAAKQAAADKATEERHRRFLLGKKAARTIKMDNGIVIVEAGQDITEEVLQKAKLANKFIELSMNVQ